MTITRPSARFATAALTALLLLGTLMPGAWKETATHSLDAPVDLAMLAHIGLFAAISFAVPLARFWNVKSWHVPTFGLTLALLTEGLQFFAIERHPNMAGIYQDMFGTLLGWAAGHLLNSAGAPRSPTAGPARRAGPASAASIPVRVSRPSGK